MSIIADLQKNQNQKAYRDDLLEILSRQVGGYDPIAPFFKKALSKSLLVSERAYQELILWSLIA